MSLLNNGALTWAFNAVVYGSPAGWGFYFTVGCVILLFLLTKYQSKLSSWQPSSQIQWVILLLITGIFITAIIWIRPLYPHMEGDGNVWEGRLRDFLYIHIGFLFTNSRVLAMQICWKSVGVLYILFCLFFVVQVTDNFWDRIVGLTYFASLPSVINFIGYVDFYGDFFTLASMFLGLLYLYYKKPSLWLLLGTVIAFIFSGLSHYRYTTLLIFPIFWICLWAMEKLKFPKPLRSLIIFLIIFGLVNTTVALVYADSPSTPRVFGFMFKQIANYDGVPIAFYHPLLLMLSFLFSYFVFLVLLVCVEKGRIFSFYQPLTGALFYGTLGMFLAYYFGQLLKQITDYELLDFICQAGCLGALFAVPMFAFIMETPWKKWFYCFVILNLFITIPNFVVHGGHGVEQRLFNSFKDERSVAGWEMSPYLQAGLHFNVDNAGPLAYKAFEMGTQDKGYYRRFNPVNWYLLIHYEYDNGNRKKGFADLENLVRDYPDHCLAFIQNELQGENKLASYHADPVRMGDIKTIAEQLFKQSKNPVYSQIITLCDKVISISSDKANSPAHK